MSKIVKIPAGSPDFMIMDGIMLARRASLSLSDKMPSEFQHMVYQWLMKGWITVDAYMLESELMWGKLSEGSETHHETIS